MAWFAAGGVGMYVVLASGLLVGLGGGLALLIAIAGWVFRPLRIVARMGGALAVFACVLPMVVGVGASAYARYQVRQALEVVDSDQREVIAAAGYAEAKIPTVFGSGLACVVLMPAALAAIVALAIPRPAGTDDDDR